MPLAVITGPASPVAQCLPVIPGVSESRVRGRVSHRDAFFFNQSFSIM
jgi:hypothetical protein